MNIQLLKQLKESGFPQDGDKGESISLGTRPMTQDEIEKMGAVIFYPYVVEEEVYSPSLTELIEACGYEGFVMWEYEKVFYAAKKEDGCRSDIYYDDYPSPAEGGYNPEEAVAYLYLELNK